MLYVFANIRPNFHQQSIATVVVAQGAENAVDRNADGGKEPSYGSNQLWIHCRSPRYLDRTIIHRLALGFLQAQTLHIQTTVWPQALQRYEAKATQSMSQLVRGIPSSFHGREIQILVKSEICIICNTPLLKKSYNINETWGRRRTFYTGLQPQANKQK